MNTTCINSQRSSSNRFVSCDVLVLPLSLRMIAELDIISDIKITVGLLESPLELAVATPICMTPPTSLTEVPEDVGVILNLQNRHKT